MAKFRRRRSRLRQGQLVWELVVLVSVFIASTTGESGFSEFYFTVEPTSTIVLKEKPALLNCSVKSDLKSSISWKRDGLPLTFDGNESKKSVLSNGSLYFKSIHHTRTERLDEGIYQCVATLENIGSIVSRGAKLQVAALPRFDEQPQDVTSFVDETVRFPCSVQGIPPATITWFKDEKLLLLDESRMIILPSGALEIDHVELSDRGTYHCNASNIERHRSSDSGTLDVIDNAAQSNKIVAPKFIATPKNIIAIEGTSVTLECAANGNPHPKITWLKDGATIDMTYLDSRFSVIGTGSLQIEHIQENDEGVYMCRAENNEDSVDANAELEVQVPPRFIKLPTNRFAHEKDDVEFECQIYGKPEPTIQWVKNGDLIIESEYFQLVNGYNLKILGVVSTDVGIYQCFGQNPAGNIQASAQLIVLKPEVPLPTTSFTTPYTDATLGGFPESADGPSAPRSLDAVVVSTRFVTLSWREPENVKGKLIIYSVFYRQEGSHRERVANTSRSRLEEINIQGLRPASKYYFRVVAYNEHGPGESSEELVVETQAEVHVPGPPLNLRAYATTATSILVQWDPPDHRNGPILRYKLYYMEVGKLEEHETQTNNLLYELRGLKKYTEYNFWVVAYNENGPGASTEEVTARTYSDVPSEVPQNVTLEAASSTSVIVRWEAPPKEEQNGVITGYKIRYKQKGSRRGDTVTTDGNRRLYALIGLERGAEYSVRVSALTVNGTGPVTDWIVIETYQNDLDESRVPDPPSSIKARPSANSITVSWTPPRNQNVMVRGYTIGWGIGIPDVYTKLVDGKQRFYNIENLQPSSEYVISLRAYNQMGDGHPRYETVKTRVETTPEPFTPLPTPMGLKAVVLSATSVVLYWTDNSLSSNQMINDNRYYTIRYTNQHHSSNPRYRYLNNSELNCIIDELKPNMEYEFAVKVSKGRRVSPWSLSVRNTTYETVPTTAPRNVTVVTDEKNPSSVNVNWQPPRQANGQIIGYIISYTTDETLQTWVVEDVDGNKLTTTISGLTPDTKYFFKIQARNRKGSSPPSNNVEFITEKSLDISGRGEGSIGQGNDEMPISLVVFLAVGCALVIIIIITVAVACFCRRRNGIIMEHKKKGYSKGKGGKTDVKPPDLWIHHDQMELKQLEKSQNSETSTSATPLTRNSQDFEPEDKLRDTLERKGTTYIGITLGDENYKNSNPPTLSRRLMRPKPIMLPVDLQQSPPREPIATAATVPNGGVQQQAGERDTQTTGRPVYPRTQYNIPRAHVTIDSSQPGTASIRPQQACSPYKKTSTLPSSSTTSSAAIIPTHKSRSAVPVVTPRAPDVTCKSERDEELVPSYSTEELNAEMANLEGLMKDLNAITASEFEC